MAKRHRNSIWWEDGDSYGGGKTLLRAKLSLLSTSCNISPKHFLKLRPRSFSSETCHWELCGYVERLRSKNLSLTLNYTYHQRKYDDYNIIAQARTHTHSDFLTGCSRMRESIMFKGWFLFPCECHVSVLNPNRLFVFVHVCVCVCLCVYVCVVWKGLSTDTLQWQTCSTLTNPKWRPRENVIHILRVPHEKAVRQYLSVPEQRFVWWGAKTRREAKATPPSSCRGHASSSRLDVLSLRRLPRARTSNMLQFR